MEVKFVPFSKLINKISGTPYIERGLSSDDLNVESFEEEQERGAFASGAPMPISRLHVQENPSALQATGLQNTISPAPQGLATQAAPEKKHPSSEKNAVDLMKGGLAHEAGIGATG